MFKYATNNDELIQLGHQMIILIALTMAEEVCKESQWTSKSLESIQNSLARIRFTNSIFKKY